MEKNNPSYYAIIPANVRYDNKLNANAKLLYGEITALCNKEGFCWSSNEYFAKLYKVSKVSISKWIKALRDGNYIQYKMIYKENSKQILNRYITIVNEPNKEKFNTPIKEKFKDNNTMINNTINKDTLSSKDDYANIYKKIIDYLNQKTGKSFKVQTKVTKSHIKARLLEGHTFDDFKSVIDTKCEQWLTDPKMMEYLRPVTLFGTKFESYLNSRIEKKEPKKKEEFDEQEYLRQLEKGEIHYDDRESFAWMKSKNS